MNVGVIRRDGRTDPFFDGAAENRLMIKRCTGCGHWCAPDAGSCPECGSWRTPEAGASSLEARDVEPGHVAGTGHLVWAPASGTATLISWAVAYSREATAGDAGEAAGTGGPGRPPESPHGGEPATLALVELAEGPWLYARLDGIAEPYEGHPLRVGFVHPADGESYPIFRENT